MHAYNINIKININLNAMHEGGYSDLVSAQPPPRVTMGINLGFADSAVQNSTNCHMIQFSGINLASAMDRSLPCLSLELHKIGLVQACRCGGGLTFAAHVAESAKPRFMPIVTRPLSFPGGSMGRD